MNESVKHTGKAYAERRKPPSPLALRTTPALRNYLDQLGVSPNDFSKVINKSKKAVINWCKHGVPQPLANEVYRCLENYRGLRSKTRINDFIPGSYERLREQYRNKRKSPFRYERQKPSKTQEQKAIEDQMYKEALKLFKENIQNN